VTPARATSDLPDILTAREAAQLLRIGRNHLYELAGRGDIPCRRLGRTLRFSRAALIRWMEQQR
jgi:excisionase family DNA binding protein